MRLYSLLIHAVGWCAMGCGVSSPSLEAKNGVSFLSAASLDNTGLERGVAPGSYVFLTGQNLATTTTTTPRDKPQEVLAGVWVTVQSLPDNSSQPIRAQLSVVSPGQITLVMPELGSAANQISVGRARLTAYDTTRGMIGDTVVEVPQVSPALETANGLGEGTIVAHVTHIGQDAVRMETLQTTADWYPEPIAVATDEYILLTLRGTGFRWRAEPVADNARLYYADDKFVPVDMARADISEPGKDILEATLSPSILNELKGRGQIYLRLWVHGRFSNAATIAFR